MATVIRPEISEKNEYWIERHRYYELKHFCMQYNSWKQRLAELDGLYGRRLDMERFTETSDIIDPVAKCVEMRAYYLDRINMVEKSAKLTSPYLSKILLKAVTEGLSYGHLQARFNLNCGRDNYYEAYRRFFWLLDKERK